MGLRSAAYPFEESMITQSYSQKRYEHSQVIQKGKLFLGEAIFTYRSVLHANVLLRLECQVTELEEVWAQTKVGQLEDLIHLDGECGHLIHH